MDFGWYCLWFVVYYTCWFVTLVLRCVGVALRCELEFALLSLRVAVLKFVVVLICFVSVDLGLLVLLLWVLLL